MSMIPYNGEFEFEKLQHWALTHQPTDEMRWKGAWWGHIGFIRDTILHLYYEDLYNTNKKYEDYMQEVSNQYDIIGTHMSKSIVLPVYEFRYKGATIVMRYNFYDYELTVISPVKLKIPNSLHCNADRFFYQGFPTKYRCDKPYSPDNSETFSITISSEYKFYTLMFLIKMQLDELID